MVRNYVPKNYWIFFRRQRWQCSICKWRAISGYAPKFSKTSSRWQSRDMVLTEWGHCSSHYAAPKADFWRTFNFQKFRIQLACLFAGFNSPWLFPLGISEREGVCQQTQNPSAAEGEYLSQNKGIGARIFWLMSWKIILKVLNFARLKMTVTYVT